MLVEREGEGPMVQPSVDKNVCRAVFPQQALQARRAHHSFGAAGCLESPSSAPLGVPGPSGSSSSSSSEADPTPTDVPRPKIACDLTLWPTIEMGWKPRITPGSGGPLRKKKTYDWYKLGVLEAQSILGLDAVERRQNKANMMWPYKSAGVNQPGFNAKNSTTILRPFYECTIRTFSEWEAMAPWANIWRGFFVKEGRLSG